MSHAWTIPHLLARVINTPLLLLPDKAELLRSLLLRKASGESISVDPSSYSQRSPVTVLPQGIAIIDIHGTTVHRTMGLEALSGLTSYEQIRADLHRVMMEDSVHSVLLNFDSPGGEAAGAFDLADVIRQASQTKHIVSMAEDQALSGAYLLASQAVQVFSSQSGTSGSIGVYLALENHQRALEAEGVDIQEVTSGDRKADGSPYQPLSDEARAVLQARADEIRTLFVGKVASTRGLTEKAVWDTQAGVFLPREAQSLGLIDGIATMDELIEELSTPPTNPRSFTVSKVDSKVETPAAAPIIQINAGTQPKDAVQTIQAGAPEVTQLIRAEERQRIVNIHACAFPGQDQLVAALIEEGVSHGEAAFRLNQDYQKRHASRLEQMRANLTKDEADLAEITTSPAPESAFHAITQSMTDDQIKQAYEANPKWKADFPRIESFLVYAKNHPEEFRA